jgi:hypothetical protein
VVGEKQNNNARVKCHYMKWFSMLCIILLREIERELLLVGLIILVAFILKSTLIKRNIVYVQ